jgi:hypothetical protein
MKILYKILSSLILFFVWTLSSCATSETPLSRAEREIRTRSHQRIFFTSFDSVWKATQLAFRYPVAINNIEEGVLESEWMDISDGFEPVHTKPQIKPLQYRIQILFVKGKVEGKSSVRVTIIKHLRTQKSFFNDSKDIESDGIEETLLFYRIGRELTLAEAIKTEAKRSHQNQRR